MLGTEHDTDTVKTHPGEVMYVVVYWLHGFNPFLICLFVLHTAIMLSAKEEHTHFVQNSLKNTLQLLNKVIYHLSDNIKEGKKP